MFTFQGIALETWVNIDSDCQMALEVNGGQAQIDLGHRTGSVHLVMSENGITKLATFVEKVRQEMQDQLAEAPQAG